MKMPLVTTSEVAESSSETKVGKFGFNSRLVTRSETLVGGSIGKAYTLDAPIEEKPCGDDEDNKIAAKIPLDHEYCNKYVQFRSVSPCLTDPNSIALVNGSPQSSNVTFENAENNDEMDDPLYSAWDEDDLSLYRSAQDEKRDEHKFVPNIEGLVADDENDDKFSSCYDDDDDDDSDNDLDVDIFGHKCNFDMRQKFSRGRQVTMTRAHRSTSAPGLSSQRPSTPWPASRTQQALVGDKKEENKANILKTLLASSIVMILAFFWID